MPRETVLFACVENAGRSQMAAALFNALADPSAARALSAGTEPAERVHPAIAQDMRGLDIELGEARPRRVTADLVARADELITMGGVKAYQVMHAALLEFCPHTPHMIRPLKRV